MIVGNTVFSGTVNAETQRRCTVTILYSVTDYSYGMNHLKEKCTLSYFYTADVQIQ